MSQPNVPNITPTITLTRDDAINLLLSSIAFEELGLAHIVNAEGEKIQFALGTLPGMTGSNATLQDVLNVNKGVQSTLETVMKKELLLGSKLNKISDIIEGNGTSGPAGPTGPAGPAGPAGPTGPVASESNAEFLLSTDINVAQGNSVPFDTPSIHGTDIMYPSNNGEIILNGNQSYLIMYSLQVSNVTETVGGAFYLDGTLVIGTQTVASTLTNSNQAILRTGPGSHILELRVTQSNINPVTINHNITTINIVRIS
ncbi:BclA C-terminal domain-containing protein [Bacillus toyonensis]|uniref:BclA C-terminal domain-containing protein n=1 Tax=Bacillus toyonensis TaxID=155322 RepID=UPI003D64DA3D